MFNAQRPRSPTLQIPCHTDLTDLTDSSTTDLNINQTPLSFNQNHKNPFLEVLALCAFVLLSS